MRYLNGLVSDLQDELGSRLLSVFVFGAKANSNDNNMHKNTDVFVIIDDYKTDDLAKFLPIIKKWTMLGNPCPVIMTKDEFKANAPSFAMEYSDLKWNNQLLFGDDYLKDINIDYFDLRNQCDRELKRIIQKVREFYLENGVGKRETILFANAAARSIIVIFRALLRINSITPSVYKHDVVDQLAKIMKFDKLFFKKMIEAKEGTYKYTPSEIVDFCNYLSSQLTFILNKFNSEQA